MTCKGPQCTRQAKTAGMCIPHYNQQWRGKPLTPLQTRRLRPVCPDGWAFCNVCEQVKKTDEFYLRKGKTVSKCKPCWIYQVNHPKTKRKKEAA